MKLIIEVKDGSNTTIHKKVSSNGMKMFLDWFAKDDVQGSFRRTTDAPEMTVGDSGSVSEHSINEPTRHFVCKECGYTLTPVIQDHCHYCGASLIYSDKPDDRTPSPTPSFR